MASLSFPNLCYEDLVTVVLCRSEAWTIKTNRGSSEKTFRGRGFRFLEIPLIFGVFVCIFRILHQERVRLGGFEIGKLPLNAFSCSCRMQGMQAKEAAPFLSLPPQQ